MATPPPHDTNYPAPQGQPGAFPPPQGQPGAFPPPQGQPGAFPPPAAPPRRGRNIGKRIIGVIITIVVIIGVRFAFSQFDQTDAETSKVGGCLHNKGTDKSPDLVDVDCSSGDAQFKIVKKFGDSTDQKQCESVAESDVYYTQSGTDFNNVVLCLQSITK
ncbi:hypothetical protein ABZ461_05675 [Actinacidiphila glaucinigra]|uniref:LppU/SCO3897 family protein n=1 Tax=Actinacidiphila glaucinigra TaxID=235986 RepID=UPI0033D6623F